jgi:cell division protein FtsB
MSLSPSRIGKTVKRQAKAALPPLLFLALAGYFVANAARGDLGLRAYAAREQDLARAIAARTKAAADVATWQRRVGSLRAEHLDADVLDERARAMLNLAEPGEIIVPYGTLGPLY